MREAALAERVAEATFEQVKAKVEADISILESRAETPERLAIEAAVDTKYLQDRQLTFASKKTQQIVSLYFQLLNWALSNKKSWPCLLYLRRGQEFTREWMESNCKIIYESQLAAGIIVGEVARFSSRFASTSDSQTHLVIK